MLTTRPTILFLAVSLLLLQLADAYSIEQLWRRSSEDAIPERAARVKEREFSVEDILKRYAAAHPERFPGVDARDLSSEELTKRYADAHSKPAGEIQGRDNRRRDSRRRDNGRRAGKKILNFPDTNAGKSIKTGKGVKNSCAKWYEIRDYIMREIFHGSCGGEARAAVRLAFHDGGTYSTFRNRLGLNNGGADGSMLSDPSEVRRPENNGLQNIVTLLQPLPKMFGVSNGDILHVAGILAVITCPGGPPIETWIGRKESKNAAPDNLLPDVRSSVPILLARFVDMGFNTRETMALIGAHTTSTQNFVDSNQAGTSQDSTPDVWDVKFYGETKNSSTPDGVFKFPSDVKFAAHPSTMKDFERYVDDQDDWNEDYSKAHEKMSLLGQDKSRMTRCTEILPPMIDLGPAFIDKDNGQDTSNSQPDDSYSLKIDRGRLRAILLRLRGYWGFS